MTLENSGGEVLKEKIEEGPGSERPILPKIIK